MEQEVEGDSITVLQHILDCDVERKSLLEEIDTLAEVPDDEMTEAQTADKAARM